VAHLLPGNKRDIDDLLLRLCGYDLDSFIDQSQAPRKRLPRQKGLGNKARLRWSDGVLLGREKLARADIGGVNSGIQRGVAVKGQLQFAANAGFDVAPGGHNGEAAHILHRIEEKLVAGRFTGWVQKSWGGGDLAQGGHNASGLG
jgi:hypothetical protein